MGDQPQRWTLNGFVEHFSFVHRKMGDHRYVWVLGAGASRSSGIPLGGELVDSWLDELYLRECTDTKKYGDTKAWALTNLKDDNVFQEFKWEDRASFYPQIFQRRFRDYPPEGYAYLEDVMSNRDPSPGYSILAATVAGLVPRPDNAPAHNVVITTNFDNLVSDAISIYTDTFPLICGHESLASFASVSLTRPLVCKVHRDLLFAPQNDPRSLKRLKDAWGIALTGLFEYYTPLVIGYGGNDDTLMDLLESLEPRSIKGQLLWTYYKESQPSARIRNVVAQHNGVLVPVPGFDLLMILLGEKMGIGLLDERLLSRAEERAKKYHRQVNKLPFKEYPDVLDAHRRMVNRSEGWWPKEQRARKITDYAQRAAEYEKALQEFPDSAELIANYASLLWHMLDQKEKAKHLWERKRQQFPRSENIIGHYAEFCWQMLGQTEEAEEQYQAALNQDPEHPNNNANYATFLWQVRRDHDEAEKHYRKSLDEAPNHAKNTGNFATFLWRVRNSHDAAQKLFDDALLLDPDNIENRVNYAQFLAEVRGEYDRAAELYQTALRLDPNHTNNNVNYVNFLIGRGRVAEAREQLERVAAGEQLPADQWSAALALLRAIIARVDDQDDTPAIQKLGTLFRQPFPRTPLSIDHVLSFAEQHVPLGDYYLYRALAEGIMDESKVPNVEELLRGRATAKQAASTGGTRGKARRARSRPASKGSEKTAS